MSQISFYLRQLLNRMWFLPAVFSAVALLTIFVAFYLARWAPEELPFTISQEAVQSVLAILATSLLTVSVFALSTLVAALSAASASTTPRAAQLIVGDRSAQTSISVFIGAFLFSILAILGLSAGIYSSAGRMLLFSVTLGVVALVVVALIRWIAQISDIGRVGHTVDRVEAATAGALKTLMEHPLFDCRLLEGEPEGVAISTEKMGYIQHFDAKRLQRLASEHDLQIAIAARPGAYVSPARPLMVVVDGEVSDELRSDLVASFVIGDQRSFDSDPRFGLVVLAEIADRALSPGVNDPGTAIDVIGTLTRLLSDWQPAQPEDVGNDRVFVPPLHAQDLLEDAFRPIARDGAGLIEVVLRLLHSLEIIAHLNPHLRDAAIHMARDAAERARRGLQAPTDLQALHAAARLAVSD